MVKKNKLEHGKADDEDWKRLKEGLKVLRESEIIKELIAMPNVIITPHMAYESQDAIDFILETTFDSIKDCINGGSKNRII